MAKQEAATTKQARDPSLPSEFCSNSSSAKQSYYYVRVPMVDSEQSPFIVIPVWPRKPDRRLRKCISCKCYCNFVLVLLVLLLAVMVAILWLSQPKLKVIRVHLNHMNITQADNGAASDAFLDTSIDVEVKIQSKEYLSCSYSLKSIYIGYQGNWLQPTIANEKFINTKGVSYIDATLGLNGTAESLWTLEAALGRRDGNGDIIYGGGLVPLDIVIEVGASYHLLYVDVPTEGKISCSISVDMEKQTIANQDCYPLHDMIGELPVP